MINLRFMLERRRPTVALFALLAAASVSIRPAAADGAGEGRSTAPVPVGPNITQIAPGDSAGFVYEKARIKRTVPLDPAAGLENKWDVLYSVQDTTGGNAAGLRTAYFDWDDTYLYLAVETPAPEQTRFDLDLADDGWLRGADNLSLVVTPPADGGNETPKSAAQRFDMAQSKDQPVWAASPIPEGEIKVVGGRTPRGTYALIVALPRTEVMGLIRKPGQGFGLRFDAAAPSLPSSAGEVTTIPVRPMLRVFLADTIEAAGEGLSVRVGIDGKRDVAPGGEIKAVVEVKNTTNTVKRLTRVYLRGSLGAADFVDDQKFAGVDIEPGKTYKKSVRSTVAPSAPFGAVVLRGGADTDSGMTLAALTAFDKIEPYELVFDLENKPVPAGGENNTDARRTVAVSLRSHSNARVTGQMKLILPDGWKLESGALQRDIALTFDGQQEGTRFKFIIPHTADLGPHTISAIAEIGGRTYKASGNVILIP